MKNSYLSILFVGWALLTCLQITLARPNDSFDDDLDIFVQLTPFDPKEILAYSLQNIVKKPLWRTTSIPNGRDALYLIPSKAAALQQDGIMISIFYNATDKMPLSLNDVFDQESINVMLESIVSLISTPGNAREVTGITPLLGNIILQERKIGSLIQMSFIKGPCIFQLKTSLLVAERNFWLSSHEREEIRQIIARNFSGTSELDESEFVRFRCGLGDTRLKMGLNLINTRSIQFDMGTEGIFPTSKIASSSKIHSSDLGTDPNQFLSTLLSNIQHLILKPHLGNGGHFGLGIYADININLFNDKVSLWSRISYDNLFAEAQDRLILFQQTIQPKDLTVSNLNDFLRQYLLPPVFNVTVHPGNIINFILGTNFNFKKYQLGVGYDFYYQREERITHINFPLVPIDDLKMGNATGEHAIQHKLFSEISYNKHYKDTTLIFNLGVDTTMSNQGIGRDWTIFLRTGFLF